MTVKLASEREAERQESEAAAKHEERLQRMAEAIQERVSDEPPYPDMPELLNARRKEYGIVDEAFHHEAVWDRILLWQIDTHQDEAAIPGGRIIRPESTRKRDQDSAPRGVLLTAGMMALDTLRSNGMDLGHIVNFVRFSPWRQPLKPLSTGERLYLVLLRDCDIIASEDLASMRAAGRVRTLQKTSDDGDLYHAIEQDGAVFGARPTKPPIPEEY